VAAAYREPIPTVDARCEAFLINHVARAASVRQGRAFLATCARSFDSDSITSLDDDVRARRLHGHHAPLFGAVLRSLAVPLPDAQAVFLHGALRGVLSAAVRLGLIGPHEAQHTQRTLAPLCDDVLAAIPDEPFQTAPALDLFAAVHDRLYSRLFQS
jgi:urease accessory protein